MKSMLFGFLLLTSFSAFAGEVHYGYNENKLAACREATQSAKAAAIDRGTCYTPCNPSQCVQKEDYYECYAVAHYYRSSCNKINLDSVFSKN